MTDVILQAELIHPLTKPVLRRKGFCSEAIQGFHAWYKAMPVVGSYSLDHVPVQWDNHPTIRDRIRQNLNLVVAYDFETGNPSSNYVDATCENVKLNAPALMPLATLMKENNLRIPAIEKLTVAVSEFFQLAKLSRSDDHAYQEAWALRRLVGKLKRFTYRSAPPQDSLGFQMKRHATQGIIYHVCRKLLHYSYHDRPVNDVEEIVYIYSGFKSW